MTSTGLPIRQFASGSTGQDISGYASAMTPPGFPSESLVRSGWQSFALDLQSLMKEPRMPSQAVDEIASPEAGTVLPALKEPSTPDQSEPGAPSKSWKGLHAVPQSYASATPRALIFASSPAALSSHGEASSLKPGSLLRRRKATLPAADSNQVEMTSKVVVHTGMQNIALYIPMAPSGEKAIAQKSSAELAKHDVPGTILTGLETPLSKASSQSNPVTAEHRLDQDSAKAREAGLQDQGESDMSSASPLLPHRQEETNEKLHSEASGIQFNEKSINSGEGQLSDQNSADRRDATSPPHTGVLKSLEANRLEAAHCQIANTLDSSHHDSLPEHARVTASHVRNTKPGSSISGPRSQGDEILASGESQTKYLFGNSSSEFMPHLRSGSAASSNDETGALRRPFDVIDGQFSNPALQWKNSGAHRAEAGFEDPDVGWISVRAHLNADGVHASLIPGSIEAAQTLASHISGLNTHIASLHPEIHPVTLSAPEPDSSSHSFGGGTNREQTENGRSNQQPPPRGREAIGPSGASTLAERNSRDTLSSSGMSPLPSVSLVEREVHVSVTV